MEGGAVLIVKCVHTPRKLKVHNTIFLVPAVLIRLTDLLSLWIISFCEKPFWVFCNCLHKTESTNTPVNKQVRHLVKLIGIIWICKNKSTCDVSQGSCSAAKCSNRSETKQKMWRLQLHFRVKLTYWNTSLNALYSN